MMMSLFRAVPVRAGHLVALFGIRTALFVPFLALLTALVERLGWLEGL